MAKILVVDDEEDVRAFLKMHLEDNGHEVVCAKDGSEGSEMLSSFNPDLAIIDIIMPHHSGIKLIEEIRNDKNMFFPVIILSAVVRYREQYEEHFRILDPPVTFVDKPFDTGRLIDTITGLLDKQ
ncbi:response regulator transcription factor [candidate division KSB1 bacterium]